MCGTKLTVSAESIAGTLGTLKVVIARAGALMLPPAASLLKPVKSSRAVSIYAPDPAVGNIFGSNLFNLAFPAVIDFFHGWSALFARIKKRHILTRPFRRLSFCYSRLGFLWVGSG
jgi:cation:H+ antiporter